MRQAIFCIKKMHFIGGRNVFKQATIVHTKPYISFRIFIHGNDLVVPG